MKFIKTLLFVGAALPTLSGCTTYNVDVILDRTGSFYSRGSYSMTFEITSKDVEEYKIKLADKLDINMIKESPQLAGKTLAIERQSDTKFAITASGVSTYDFKDYSGAEFMLYFQDSLISAKGFHSCASALIQRSKVEFTLHGFGKKDGLSKGHGTLTLGGVQSNVSDWSTAGLVSLKNVTSGTVAASVVDGEIDLQFADVAEEEGKVAQVVFSKSCFDVDKEVTLDVKFVLGFSSYQYF